jgi:hypothetical protein
MSRWSVLALTGVMFGTGARGTEPASAPQPLQPVSLIASTAPERVPDLALAMSALLPVLEAGQVDLGELEALLRSRDLPTIHELAVRAPAAIGDCIEPDAIDGPPVPDSLDVRHYTLEILAIDELEERVQATTTVSLALLAPDEDPTREFDRFELHLSSRLDVTGVEMARNDGNFVPVPFRHADDLLRVGPFESIRGEGRADPNAGPSLQVRVHYGSTSTECTSTNGIPSGFAFNRVGLHTFSEPTFARHWYPCHDVPRDKATATIRVTVPDGRVVSASGALVADEMIDGARVMTWEHTDPLSTYLIAFYVGDYVKLTDTGPAGLPLEYFVTPETATAAPVDFANLPDMVEFFSSIHPYPYPRYAMTLGWFGGGMEHVMNSLIGVFAVTGDRSSETLFVHELAHQWWGDLLTPETWRDIWLNEGFARFSEWLYFEHRYGWQAMSDLRSTADRVYMENIDERPELDHPILDPAPNKLFTFVVYNKGGRVLDMLRGVSRLRLMQGAPPRPPGELAESALRGDERFLQLLSDYAAAHQFGNVTTRDFVVEAERALGEDLSWFFDSWLLEPSHPHLKLDWTNTQGPGTTFLNVRLRQTEGPVVPMPLHVRYRSGDRVLDEVRELRPALDWVVELPPGEWRVILDPEDWLLDQHEITSIAPRETPLAVYPNPSSIGFSLSATLNGSDPAAVGLTVFDAQGRLVRGLDLGVQNPGPVSLRWDGNRGDGRRAAAGVYFARLQLGSQALTTRLVLLP